MPPPPFHPACARPRRAFTLIELLAVLVVLALLSASIAPLMRSATGASTPSAARQTAESILFARELATQSGVRTWVVFNTSTQRMTMLRESLTTPGRALATPIPDIAGTGMHEHRYSADATLTSAAFTDASVNYAEIGFDNRGRPILPTGNVLTDADGIVTITGPTSTWRVRVAPRTGLAWAEVVP